MFNKVSSIFDNYVSKKLCTKETMADITYQCIVGKTVYCIFCAIRLSEYFIFFNIYIFKGNMHI